MPLLETSGECPLNVLNPHLEPDDEGLRLTLAIVLALFFHTIVGLLISKLFVLPELTLSETIYVKLAPAPTASVPHQVTTQSATQDTAESSASDTVTTTAESRFSASENENMPSPTPMISQPIDIDVTQFRESTARSTESQVSSPLKNAATEQASPHSAPPLLGKRTFNTIDQFQMPTEHSSESLDVSKFFEQKPLSEQATKTRVASTKSKSVTAYEKILIEHMAQSQNYDKQFDFSSIKQPRHVEMEIKLQKSGALEKANILSSSGLPSLDKAALRSAYTASPFPKPPSSHIENGFRYELSITYTPRSDS